MVITAVAELPYFQHKTGALTTDPRFMAYDVKKKDCAAQLNGVPRSDKASSRSGVDSHNKVRKTGDLPRTQGR